MALGNLTDVKLGGAQVSKIYIGSSLVWQKATEEDTDYLAFINAAVITDNTQKSAVNYLVTELKSKGLWSKMIAIYPFVGGNANAHKFNLKNPQDSDAAFRLLFNSVNHSANGIVNGNCNTFVSTANVNLDSLSFGFYSRTNSANSGSDITASVDAGSRIVAHSRYTDGNAYFDLFNASSNRIVVSGITDSLGTYVITRSANNIFKVFKNGLLLGSNNNPLVSSFSNTIQISGTATYTTNRNYAFAFIGSGLTDTDATNLTNTIQQYQTMLGRAV